MDTDKKSYETAKAKFIVERDGLIKSINDNFGDRFKEQIEKFITDTNDNLKTLDRNNLTSQKVHRLIAGQDKPLQPEEIFRFSTGTANTYKKIFNSDEPHIINSFMPIIPEALESISGQLTKSIIQLSKNTGRSH